MDKSKERRRMIDGEGEGRSLNGGVDGCKMDGKTQKISDIPKVQSCEHSLVSQQHWWVFRREI
jgi:hypothetical protein